MSYQNRDCWAQPANSSLGITITQIFKDTFLQLDDSFQCTLQVIRLDFKDPLRLTTLHSTPSKKADSKYAKSSCAPPNQYKATLCTAKVQNYKLWTLICMFVVNHKTILYWYASMLVHHLCKWCIFVVIIPGKCALECHTMGLIQSKWCFHCLSLWPMKYGQKVSVLMFLVTPTSHGHRSPLCTMVHNASRWCTTQIGGVQPRSVVHNVILYLQSGAQNIGLTNPHV